MKMSGHVPNAMTDGVLGDLHPDLDKGVTELLDSLSCSLDQAWGTPGLKAEEDHLFQKVAAVHQRQKDLKKKTPLLFLLLVLK